MVLHHNTVMKCVSGCLKIIRGAELVVDMKLQFPSLHSNLTWILSVFSVGIFENQGVYLYSQY
jgi:hypothetical protein